MYIYTCIYIDTHMSATAHSASCATEHQLNCPTFVFRLPPAESQHIRHPPFRMGVASKFPVAL